MRRIPLTAVAAGALALAAPAGAHASALTVTPNPASVSRSVTVSFAPPRRLPAGERYSALITIDGVSGRCSTVAARTSTSRARRVRITLRSRDGNFDGGPRWCAGTATIRVLRGKAGGGPATTIGQTHIRIRG